LNNKNYQVVEQQLFYKALQPNVTITKSGIVYFNSSTEEEDNAAPAKFADTVLKSSTHCNFINLKSNLLTGSNLFPVEEKNTSLTAFIEQENKRGESLENIFPKMCYDISLYGASAIQVIYSVEGQVSELYYTKPSRVRAEAPDEYGRVCNWYYSDSWGIIDGKKNHKPAKKDDAIKIAAFNPSTWKEDGGRQLLYIKGSKATQDDIYGLPDYEGALKYIDVENELADFILAKLQNGFFPSMMITFFNSLSPEEKDEVVQKSNSKFKGAKKHGTTMFNFSDTATQEPKVTTLEQPTNAELIKTYLEVAQQRIATAHGASLELAGVQTSSASMGGDANKLSVSLKYWQMGFINPLRQPLLAAINKVLKVNGLGEVTVTDTSLKLLEPAIQNQDTTVDERREMLMGLPPIANNISSTPTE
jgi:hypothetical protein